jgi:hypothetical protein
MPTISRHAVKRIRERLGLPKKAAEREVERALDGIDSTECSGQLRRYLDRMSIERNAYYKVTPSGIFTFSKSDGVLVTVLPVPEHLRSIIQNIWQKRSLSEEGTT